MALEGMREILDTFNRMERAAQLRAMRSALNASMTPMVRELRRSAPKGSKPHKVTPNKGSEGYTVPPGFLSRSITKSTRISRDKSRVFGSVRLRDAAWYGSLIEHGWRPGKRSARIKRYSRREGSLSESRLKQLGDTRSRKIPGRPWFNPAVDRVDDEVADAFIDKMGQAIIREWLK